MAKVLSCRDVGVDCGFEATGETEKVVIKKSAQHAEEAYGMSEIPPEAVEMCQKAIRDV